MDKKEKKKKDNQLGPSSFTREPDMDGVSLNSKLDEDHGEQDERSQNPVDAVLNGKKPRVSGPLNENVPFQIHQGPPNFHWPYSDQPANDNRVAGASTPCLSPSPVLANQWQPQGQMNAGFHQTQQFQMPPNLYSSNAPGFFPPQRPSFQPQGAHNIRSCHQFPQMGSSDNGWQVPSGNGLVTAPRNPGQIPSGFYQFGHPLPNYPAGPWDSSSWWGQMQQFLPFCAYPFPGACNYFPTPAPRPTTNWSAASGKSSQKGVIQPCAKMQQQHQPKRESQPAENAQLWATIAALQADLADVRNRLIKFEAEGKFLPADIRNRLIRFAAEGKFLKSEEEQLAGYDTGNTSTSQATKRGRPKKLVATFDALPSSDEPHPSPRGTRPAFSKPPLIKEINFQKDHENKVEFMETMSPLIPTHANGEKFRSDFSSCSNPVEDSSAHPPYQSLNLPNFRQSQGSMMVSNSSEAKDALAKLQGQVKNLVREVSSAAYVKATNHKNHGWPFNVPPGGCSGQMISATSHGYYQGNVPGQGNRGIVE